MPWTLITGASKDIGAQICQALAKNGHNVVVHYYQNKERANNVVEACRKEGVQAESIQGDFSTAEGVELFLKNYCAAFSNTAYLVNNASVFLQNTALETSMNDWQTLYQVNFFAPLAIMQSLKNSIITNQGGIINLGVAGLQANRAAARIAPYYSTKLALLHATKSLAVELAPNGVNVNMVSPGYVENTVITPSTAMGIPAKRYASISEIAAAICFFLAKESSYVTGQNLEVSGALAL